MKIREIRGEKKSHADLIDLKDPCEMKKNALPTPRMRSVHSMPVFKENEALKKPQKCAGQSALHKIPCTPC